MRDHPLRHPACPWSDAGPAVDCIDPAPIAEPAGFIVLRRHFRDRTGRWDDEWLAQESIAGWDDACDGVGEALDDAPGPLLDPRRIVRVVGISTGVDCTHEALIEVAARMKARSLDVERDWGDWFDRYRHLTSAGRVAEIKAARKPVEAA